MNFTLPQERLFTRKCRLFLYLVAVGTALVVIAALLPPGMLGHLPIFVVTTLGKYLCYAILALSVDLLWGYLGILTLGHCAFFALGGYVMGMYLALQGAGKGLPEFMSFLNYSELPWYWYGAHSLGATIILIIAVPGALAWVFGWMTFHSRVSGVYLSIITQALTYGLMLAFFLNELGLGGNNGLTGFKTIAGFDLNTDGTRLTLFALIAGALIGSFIVIRYVLVSRLGRLIIAVRDAEARTRFIGYRVENVKLMVFVLAAMIAGVAGALYVPMAGIINPGEFSPLNSIEIIICVALGGRGHLYGAVLGAILVHVAKTWFTQVLPDYWLFVLGGLFVVVTVLMPQGVLGLLPQLKTKLKAPLALGGAA